MPWRLNELGYLPRLNRLSSAASFFALKPERRAPFAKRASRLPYLIRSL
jgi:hypothetical protein